MRRRQPNIPHLVAGQLARLYKLLYRASNSRACNVVDAHAAYGSEMSIWCSVMGGYANLVYHGAGRMEGGLTASFEKIVLDVEMLQMMAETIKPIDVNPETLDAFVARRKDELASVDR